MGLVRRQESASTGHNLQGVGVDEVLDPKLGVHYASRGLEPEVDVKGKKKKVAVLLLTGLGKFEVTVLFPNRVMSNNAWLSSSSNLNRRIRTLGQLQPPKDRNASNHYCKWSTSYQLFHLVL